MRAVVMRAQQLVVDTVPQPEPLPGEVLVKTLACGICGSDLHALKHAAQMTEVMRRSGAPMVMDPARDVVMGHEFCAEIVDHGPGSAKMLPVGTRVCSMPLSMRPTGLVTVGYSNDAPGGYGEYMVLSEMLLLQVPNGLSTTLYHLAEGRIAAAALITGTVGVEGVAGAFAELSDPERHAKILVEPWH